MAHGRATRREALGLLCAGAAALAGCGGDGGTEPGTTDAQPTTGGSTTAPTEATATAEPTDPFPTGRDAIAVNQVQYGTEPVVAIVPGETTTARVTDDSSTATPASLSTPIEDAAAGETVRRATVAGLDAGSYRAVATDGEATARSFRFGVGDTYGDVLRDALRAYSLKRSGTAISDPVTGLDTEGGHPDSEAAMYTGDEFHEEGAELDVSGGWYDAGDYGKYVPTGAVAVAQHLLAFDTFPAPFGLGNLNLPHGEAENAPDVLREARFELEWLARMQRPDGMVYHKVAGENWPAMETLPSEDTQQRYVFGRSTYGTAMVGGAAALAARVYRPFDAAFADRMLGVAESAFDYLDAHPEAQFLSAEGQNSGSGAYRKTGDRTERFWLAAELLRTTGDARYAEHLHAGFDGEFDARARPVSWTDAFTLGQWAYVHAEGADPARVESVRERVLAAGKAVAAAVADDGYRVALSAGDYVWGSAKYAVSKGMLCLLANELAPSEELVRAAADQVDYVLGRSPTGASYLTGWGERSVKHPHDRLVVSTGTTIPGLLVGGPNADGGDPVLDAYIRAESPPPAKCYRDETEAYSCNEWAIDYTAPLVFALAGLR